MRRPKYPDRRLRLTEEEFQAERQSSNQQRDADRQIEDAEQQVRLEKARLDLETLRSPRQQDALDSTTAPTLPSDAKQSSGYKGPRRGTLAAAAAVHRYLSDNGQDPTWTPAAVALQATEYAVKLGFHDADLLNPKGSTIQQVAKRLLEAHRHQAK
jgi:hypothetical protein